MAKFILSVKYHLIDKLGRYVLLLNMPPVQARSESGSAASGAGDREPVGAGVGVHAAAPKGFATGCLEVYRHFSPMISIDPERRPPALPIRNDAPQKKIQRRIRSGSKSETKLISERS